MKFKEPRPEGGRAREYERPSFEKRDIRPDTKVLPEGLIRPGLTSESLELLYEGEVYHVKLFWDTNVRMAPGERYELIASIFIPGVPDPVASIEADKRVKDDGDGWDWTIYHREVEEDQRKRGLGTLAFVIMNDFVRQYASNILSQASYTLSMEVGQGALARLLVDQDWLREQGQDQYLHKDGSNLGYRPETDEDVDVMKQLLIRSRSEALSMEPAPEQRARLTHV